MSAGSAAADGSFEAALTSYERCDWPEAYALLARLADHGDERASQIALLMARHGPRLFGGAFPVTLLQAARWERQALAGLHADPKP